MQTGFAHRRRECQPHETLQPHPPTAYERERMFHGGVVTAPGNAGRGAEGDTKFNTSTGTPRHSRTP